MTGSDDKSVLLVNAYLDGELDHANALGITQQIDTEPEISSEADVSKALHESIRRQQPPLEATTALGAKIDSSVGGFKRERGWPAWRALAASIALTAFVSSSATCLTVG